MVSYITISHKLNWTARNILYFTKHFSLHDGVYSGVHFIVDDSKAHPGLLDIMKAIIGVYYIAKENRLPFSLTFTSPFTLIKYLEPNRVDWIPNSTDIQISPKDRMLNYEGCGVIPKLRPYRHYYVYNFRGWNILQRNNIDQWESLWSSLFQDLFKPTKYLETIIRSIPFPENSYIAVHIRFVNAIEIIEPAYKRSTLLSELEQNALIEACFNKISEISLSKKKPVVIFSDSNRFLSEARKLGYCVISGNVGHIKYSHSQDVIDKTFLDLYALARAESIFSIVGENLYQSVFPLYGALINNKQFHRVNI